MKSLLFKEDTSLALNIRRLKKAMREQKKAEQTSKRKAKETNNTRLLLTNSTSCSFQGSRR